jgi:hypothetical protein
MKIRTFIEFLETLPPSTYVCYKDEEYGGGPGDSFTLHDMEYMPIEGTLLIKLPTVVEDEEGEE